MLPRTRSGPPLPSPPPSKLRADCFYKSAFQTSPLTFALGFCQQKVGAGACEAALCPKGWSADPQPQRGGRIPKSWSGSCGALPCLDTNAPDTVPEHKTLRATRTTLSTGPGEQGKGKQQGRSKAKVPLLSLAHGITGIHTLFSSPETWFQEYGSGICRTFLTLTFSYRHQYLMPLHRIKTVPNKAIKPQKHWMV